MELIAKIMRFSMFFGFLIGWISLVIFLFNKYIRIKKEINRIAIFSAIFGVVLFVSGEFIANKLFNHIKNDFSNFIENYGDQTQVTINGNQIVKSNIVLENLKGLKHDVYHHSHPSERIVWVMLKANGESWNISVCQDSECEYEFWIFIDNYYLTSKDEIGKIISRNFLDYLKDLKINNIKYPEKDI
jgi:hypothetical protein